MPKSIDAAVNGRALRMFADHRGAYFSGTALAEAVTKKLGVGGGDRSMLLVQADVTAGARAGTTSDEQPEIKRLKAEVRKLREDNEILKTATVFFAGELHPSADHGVHRRHESGRPRGRVDLPGPARAGLPGRRADLSVLEAGQPPDRCPHPHRCGPDRRAAAGAQCPRRALRAPQHDPSAARTRAPGGVLHCRSPDAGSGDEQGPPRT